MRLKSLDKYIKDKVQGYKAPYQEDLWKGIEEKLPAPRVPNGYGSWMLPVAAIVAIAILAPFTIKFYNLTGRTQVAVLKNNEITKSKSEIASNGNNAIISSSKPSLAITSMLSPDGLKTRKVGHFRQTARNSKSDSKHNFGIEKSVISDETVSLPQQIIQTTAVASNSESASKNEMMAYIMPGFSTIENGGSGDISDASDTKYLDRKNPHPINNQKWENWQSIYYAFWDNPAYAGSEGKVNISADYKIDNSIGTVTPSSQHTYSNLGIDGYIPGLGLGVGLYKVSELSPFSLQNTYGLAVSKSILQLGSTSVKIGVSGTAIDNNFFFSQLNYSDQINPKFGFINATSEKYIEGTTRALGLNAGLWVSNPHIIAGFDVQDINQPKLGISTDALALDRQWRGTFGYRFAPTPDLQIMPMAIITSESKVNQVNTMLTAVYKDKYMLSFAYGNIDPISGLGNTYVYGAARIAKRVRVFASYGLNLDLLHRDINETFVQAGVKVLVLR